MRKSNIQYTVACLVLVIAGLFVNDRVNETENMKHDPVMELPHNFNEYYGEDITPLYGYYYDNPQADEKILRTYKNDKDNGELYVFIGYWKNQNGEKRIIPPRYTEERWSYYWIKKTVLTTGSTKVNLKKFLNEKGPRKELVYYCYIVNDKTISSEFHLKVMSIINLFLKNSNSAALLRVAMPVTDEWPLEKAEVFQEAFIKEIIPLLVKIF